MKKGLYQDFEREWRKWKRLRFFYFVLPVFLTILSVRIIQVYFHLKMEQLKKAAAACRREEAGEGKKGEPPAQTDRQDQQRPVPVSSQKADMEWFTPQPAPEKADEAGAAQSRQESSCTVTEEL